MSGEKRYVPVNGTALPPLAVEDDVLELIGDWERHPQFGLQPMAMPTSSMTGQHRPQPTRTCGMTYCMMTWQLLTLGHEFCPPCGPIPPHVLRVTLAAEAEDPEPAPARTLPSSEGGVVKFLIKHLQRVGPATARKMVEAFGADSVQEVRLQSGSLVGLHLRAGVM